MKKSERLHLEEKYLYRKKKKRGKPKKQKITLPKYMSFKEARYYIRLEEIGSKGEFDFWFNMNRPARIPKRPDQYYGEKGWKGWNDFLGNNNPPFKPKFTYVRPYEEARAYAQTLGLGSQLEWLEYIKVNEIPKDIPRRPDIYYNKKNNAWISWKNFLGYNNFEKIQSQNSSKAILYICKLPHRPDNVYKLGVTTGGLSSIEDAIKKYNIRVYKMFSMKHDFNWKTPLEQLGSIYPNGVEDEYIIPNFFNLISFFESRLTVVNPPRR